MRVLVGLAVGVRVLMVVEDVGVLCSRFAIMRAGRLVTQTSPSAARKALENTIYEAAVSGEELESLQATHCVTQTLLVEGKNRVRIHHTAGTPPTGFSPVAPTLEDAYLVSARRSSSEAIIPA